jgi:hypothetical protein
VTIRSARLLGPVFLHAINAAVYILKAVIATVPFMVIHVSVVREAGYDPGRNRQAAT